MILQSLTRQDPGRRCIVSRVTALMKEEKRKDESELIQTQWHQCWSREPRYSRQYSASPCRTVKTPSMALPFFWKQQGEGPLGKHTEVQTWAAPSVPLMNHHMKPQRLSNHIWLPYWLLGGSESHIYGDRQKFMTRDFFSEQNQGKEKIIGRLWDNPRLSVSPKCIQSNIVSERSSSPGKTHEFQRHVHSCSRSDPFSHSLQILWRIKLPLVRTLPVWFGTSYLKGEVKLRGRNWTSPRLSKWQLQRVLRGADPLPGPHPFRKRKWGAQGLVGPGDTVSSCENSGQWTRGENWAFCQIFSED